ncbi:hypothetical protein MKEN_00628800 [Mycena kentingensis (nom. inval.)]|nr:hypothetical protein MKEN_00628800 [Mycena kentingensis (nom. inval.)]
MASLTNVIVDERNSAVHYAGTWTEAGEQVEFGGTTKCTVMQGSTASFTFIGTSISVFGTVVASLEPQGSMDFVIDNRHQLAGTYRVPPASSSDLHHQLLYTSPPLDDAQHTLVMTQTGIQGSDATICLDYMTYELGEDPDASVTDGAAFLVDDRDSRIAYDPPWRMVGGEGDMMQTVQGSKSAGSTMKFSFEGDQILLYGSINNGASPVEMLNASIIIDAGPPISFAAPPQSAVLTWNNLIFTSGDLSPGQHTLVLTAENDNAVWVDYLLVRPSSGSPNNGRSRTKTKDQLVGAAIGVGILLLVTLLIIGGWIFLRRRRGGHLWGRRFGLDSRRVRSLNLVDVDGDEDAMEALGPEVEAVPFTAQSSSSSSIGNRRTTPLPMYAGRVDSEEDHVRGSESDRDVKSPILAAVDVDGFDPFADPIPRVPSAASRTTAASRPADSEEVDLVLGLAGSPGSASLGQTRSGSRHSQAASSLRVSNSSLPPPEYRREPS